MNTVPVATSIAVAKPDACIRAGVTACAVLTDAQASSVCGSEGTWSLNLWDRVMRRDSCAGSGNVGMIPEDDSRNSRDRAMGWTERERGDRDMGCKEWAAVVRLLRLLPHIIQPGDSLLCTVLGVIVLGVV
jgi:hypothetical protein